MGLILDTRIQCDTVIVLFFYGRLRMRNLCFFQRTNYIHQGGYVFVGVCLFLSSLFVC